jgi:hypothetical protein
MAIKEQTIEAIALKKLNSVAHTGSQFALANEAKGTGLSIRASNIFSDIIPSDVELLRTIALGNTDPEGVVEKVRFDVTAMAGTNNGNGHAQTYQLSIPLDYGGILGEEVRGKKLLESDGRLQLVPASFAPVDTSTGMSPYKARLYSGNPSSGTLINDASDAREFIVDYFNGTIFLDNPATASGAIAFVEAFLYVGAFADDKIRQGADTTHYHTYKELYEFMMDDGVQSGHTYVMTDFPAKFGTQTLILQAVDKWTFAPIVTTGNNPDDIVHFEFWETDIKRVNGVYTNPTVKGKILYREFPYFNIKAHYDWRASDTLTTSWMFMTSNIYLGSGTDVINIQSGIAKNLTIGNNVKGLNFENITVSPNMANHKIQHEIYDNLAGGKFSIVLERVDTDPTVTTGRVTEGVSFWVAGTHGITFLPPNSVITNFKLACNGLVGPAEAMISITVDGSTEALIEPTDITTLNNTVNIVTTMVQNGSEISTIKLNVIGGDLDNTTSPQIKIWGEYICLG